MVLFPLPAGRTPRAHFEASGSRGKVPGVGPRKAGRPPSKADEAKLVMQGGMTSLLLFSWPSLGIAPANVATDRSCDGCRRDDWSTARPAPFCGRYEVLRWKTSLGETGQARASLRMTVLAERIQGPTSAGNGSSGGNLQAVELTGASRTGRLSR
jgi:hypothetical protein